MATIYRIEHQETRLGPWNSFDNHLRPILTFDVEEMMKGTHYFFSKKGRDMSWYYSNNDHIATLNLECFEDAIQMRWRVGCVSLIDLRYWFKYNDMLEVMHDIGYVFCQYLGIPNSFIVNDKTSKQCMFAHSMADEVKTESVLNIANIPLE